MAKTALLITSLGVFSPALHRLHTSLMPLLEVTAEIKTDPETSGKVEILQQVRGQRELVYANCVLGCAILATETIKTKSVWESRSTKQR